jgi:hypothetical protein
MPELMDRLAALNRMLAEFAILADDIVGEAAQDAYKNAQEALHSAQDGSLGWIDSASAAATRFTHVARAALNGEMGRVGPGPDASRRREPSGGANTLSSVSLRLQRGTDPLRPSEDSEVLKRYDDARPLGVFRQADQQYVGARLGDEKDGLELWYYFPIEPEDRARIETAPDTERQSVVNGLTSTGPAVLAFSRGGLLLDSEVVPQIDDRAQAFSPALVDLRLRVGNGPSGTREG